LTTAATVTLRYFALVREQIGRKEEEALIEGNRVSDVLLWLRDRYGDKLIPFVMDQNAKLRSDYRLLHNGTVCPLNAIPKTKIADGDELVIVPPVAGG
jgi:MoaD family protein